MYNYLLNLDLIPQSLLKMTKSEMKSYVDSVSLLYVRDNREALSLFFWVWEYIFDFANDHAKIFELFSVKKNKPGTAQVGAISKAQKDSKTTFSTTGDNKSSQKTKNWEKKFPNFFWIFFAKFPVSRIVPKM